MWVHALRHMTKCVKPPNTLTQCPLDQSETPFGRLPSVLLIAECLSGFVTLSYQASGITVRGDVGAGRHAAQSGRGVAPQVEFESKSQATLKAVYHILVLSA